jgi:hypothetical protein
MGVVPVFFTALVGILPDEIAFVRSHATIGRSGHSFRLARRCGRRRLPAATHHAHGRGTVGPHHDTILPRRCRADGRNSPVRAASVRSVLAVLTHGDPVRGAGRPRFRFLAPP